MGTWSRNPPRRPSPPPQGRIENAAARVAPDKRLNVRFDPKGSEPATRCYARTIGRRPTGIRTDIPSADHTILRDWEQPPDAPLAHCCWPPSAILLSCGDCSRKGPRKLSGFVELRRATANEWCPSHRPWCANNIDARSRLSADNQKQSSSRTHQEDADNAGALGVA
jgi:hypothetical protein